VEEAPPGELEAVPPVTAAKVQNTVVEFKVQAPTDQVDFRARYPAILHDVPVGLEIESIEYSIPPIFRNMLL
jgi:hypothetical protein